MQSVDRAVTVLEILARRGEAGVTELADEMGVHKSTAFRLVAALENRGLVEQRAERGKYALGFGIVRLAGATTARYDLIGPSLVIGQHLADEIGETVNIAVLQDNAAINIHEVRGPAQLSVQGWLGQRTPLHATSSGKVLLAYLPEQTLDAILAAPLAPVTPQTIVDPGVLRGQLTEIRQTGYGVTFEELEPGLNAVAAPIRSHHGVVIAAISVSGPAFRLSADQIAGVAKAVTEAGADISARLGYVPCAPG
jgi:DNA-binding IclR family transcriptional regulator